MYGPVTLGEISKFAQLQRDGGPGGAFPGFKFLNATKDCPLMIRTPFFQAGSRSYEEWDPPPFANTTCMIGLFEELYEGMSIDGRPYFETSLHGLRLKKWRGLWGRSFRRRGALARCVI